MTEMSWCAYVCSVLDKMWQYDETDIYFIL